MIKTNIARYLYEFVHVKTGREFLTGGKSCEQKSMTEGLFLNPVRAYKEC